jgi:hypothetical protein
MQGSRVHQFVIAALLMVMASAEAASGAAAGRSASLGWTVSPTKKWYQCTMIGTYTVNAAHFGLIASDCHEKFAEGVPAGEVGPTAPWNGQEFHFVVWQGLTNGSLEMVKQYWFEGLNSGAAIARGNVVIFTNGEAVPAFGGAIKVTRIMKVTDEIAEGSVDAPY